MENELDIVCQECGITFVYRTHPNRPTREPPTRCSLCRAEQSHSANTSTKPIYTGDRNEYRSPMACDFPEPRYTNRIGSRRPQNSQGIDGGGPGRKRRDHRPMFTGVCAECGATAHLPFQPSKFQQVLCRACFQEKRGSRSPSEPTHGS